MAERIASEAPADAARPATPPADSLAMRRWYRALAPVYDLGCRPLYAGARRAGIRALRLRPGETVLDLCTGTGLNLPALADAVGPDGRVVGVDLTPAMLARARRRIRRGGLDRVVLHTADARRLDAAAWAQSGFGQRPDAVLCSFGLAVAPGWRALFASAWDLLRPGGRFVVVDNRPLGPGLRRALNPALVPLSNLLGHARIQRPTEAVFPPGSLTGASHHLGGYVHVSAARKAETRPSPEAGEERVGGGGRAYSAG